jgi:hypothetical protein
MRDHVRRQQPFRLDQPQPEQAFPALLPRHTELGKEVGFGLTGTSFSGVGAH